MTRGAHPGDRSENGHTRDKMRLRDLIPALRAQHRSASALLHRIDPLIADELRAVAAHRNVDLSAIAADCLEQLALDAADAIWQLGIEQHSGAREDPEAALLGSILRKAVRARLRRERMLGAKTIVQTVFVGFRRSGHPYNTA